MARGVERVWDATICHKCDKARSCPTHPPAGQATGKGYGHEIAWLSVAENAAQAAMGFAQGSSRSTLAAGLSTECASQLASVRRHLPEALHAGPLRVPNLPPPPLLGQAARQRRVAAVRDNSAIYMNAIPPVSDLPTIPRAALAKAVFPADIEVASPDM